MKKGIYLCLIALLIIVSCSREKKPPHIGAWQLVSWHHFSGDSIDWRFPGDYTGSNIVIFSDRHILSVGIFKRDSTVRNNYVGASYTLTGDRFEETLLYSPDPAMVGHKVKQILKVLNDTLIKTYPCDDNWELIQDEYYIEKYVNLE